MPTYSYDENLVTVVDHARYHLGDIASEWLLPNETINAQINTYGWVVGMSNLVSGLLARFGQEPIKQDEGNGLMVDLSGRLKQWQLLKARLDSGSIPDPRNATPSNVQSPVFDSVSASNNFGW